MNLFHRMFGSSIWTALHKWLVISGIPYGIMCNASSHGDITIQLRNGLGDIPIDFWRCILNLCRIFYQAYTPSYLLHSSMEGRYMYFA